MACKSCSTDDIIPMTRAELEQDLQIVMFNIQKGIRIADKNDNNNRSVVYQRQSLLLVRGNYFMDIRSTSER